MSSLSFLRSTRFVDDTVEDIIHSIDYVVTKTGLTQHRWSKSGECRECQRPGPQHWCIPYETRRFQRKFKKWTSGNDELDQFIRQTQLAASSHTDYIEWISFERFQEVQKIGQGGFGIVYSALWLDGPKWEWRQRTQRWARRGRTTVALKSLHNSKNIGKEFVEEIKLHHRSIIGEHIPRCYGITQSSEGEYMLVMQYASEGSLRSFLSRKFVEIGWKDRLQMLTDIIDGLRMIHNTSLLHCDFHTGNILRHVDESGHAFTYIADLGLCNPVSAIKDKRASFQPPSADSKPVYGVLPYVAPEVVRGGEYTKAADIYSFGVVMWEICSGDAPFQDRAHNIHLAMDICKGLRPSISQLSATPKCYIELMERCWDAKPEKRPDVQELRQTLDRFYTEFKENEFDDAEKERLRITEEDKESSSAPPVPPKGKHPHAIYTSRPLNFLNLPEPQNSSSYEPSNYEFIEFEEGDVGKSGQLELFIPQTDHKSPLLKIPEVKIDSILFPLDTLSQISGEPDEY